MKVEKLQDRWDAGRMQRSGEKWGEDALREFDTVGCHLEFGRPAGSVPVSEIVNPFLRISQSFLPSINEELDGCIERLDAAIRSETLTHMLRYHLGLAPYDATSGKRLRGVLAMIIGRTLQSPPSAAKQLAVALELKHAASLAHDDIQDEDELRWGRPTLWAKFDISSAINVGDTLTALTYDTLGRLALAGVSTADTVRVLQLFSETFLLMAEGQQLDLDQEARFDLSVDQYLYMVARKTAASFECSCAAPAIVSDFGPDVETALRTFGSSFGIIYQIADDLASLFLAQAETGKAPLGDLYRSKATLPLLLELAEHPRPENGSEEERAALLTKFSRNGTRERCVETAARHVMRATDALETLSGFDTLVLEELLEFNVRRIGEVST